MDGVYVFPNHVPKVLAYPIRSCLCLLMPCWIFIYQEPHSGPLGEISALAVIYPDRGSYDRYMRPKPRFNAFRAVLVFSSAV